MEFTFVDRWERLWAEDSTEEAGRKEWKRREVDGRRDFGNIKIRTLKITGCGTQDSVALDGGYVFSDYFDGGVEFGLAAPGDEDVSAFVGKVFGGG
jgi:hypothetical protein